MGYPGFCAKYGLGKVLTSAYALSALLVAAERLAFAPPEQRALNLVASPVFWAAEAGLITAIIGHDVVNHILKVKGVGMTRGGVIVRRFQAAAYGIPVALGLTFSVMTAPDKKPEEPPPVHYTIMDQPPASAAAFELKIP